MNHNTIVRHAVILTLWVMHIAGASLLGVEFGWKVGVASFLLTYVVMFDRSEL